MYIHKCINVCSLPFLGFVAYTRIILERQLKSTDKQSIIRTLAVHFVEINAVFIMFQVVYCMDRCLEISPGCSRFKVLKAECLALLKRYDEAQIIAK